MVVAALTREMQTNEARAALRAADVMASNWTVLEAISGLSKKRRMESIGSAEFELALDRLEALQADHWQMVPTFDSHMRQAGRYLTRPELKLRAGDSLHLAIVAALSVTLVTSDRVMAEAAVMIGLEVQQIG